MFNPLVLVYPMIVQFWEYWFWLHDCHTKRLGYWFEVTGLRYALISGSSFVIPILNSLPLRFAIG